MDDLISRQAALSALADAMPSLTTPDGCGQFDHDIQVTDEAYVDCMRIIHDLPSAQPDVPDTNVGDMISRRTAVSCISDLLMLELKGGRLPTYNEVYRAIYDLPPAQPNLSEAYSKAVFTWLMDYQIRAAELNGRYTPYEVLSWVINDWRKENG